MKFFALLSVASLLAVASAQKYGEYKSYSYGGPSTYSLGSTHGYSGGSYGGGLHGYSAGSHGLLAGSHGYGVGSKLSLSGLTGLSGLGYGYGTGVGTTYALVPVAATAAPAVSYAAPAVSYAAPAVATVAAAPAVSYAAPAVTTVAAAPAVSYGAHSGSSLVASLTAAAPVQSTQVTGPVHAAIETRRTVEVVDGPSSDVGAPAQTVVIGPNVQPLNLEFQTQASPLSATQNHLPSQPAPPQQASYEEQPDLLRQDIVKPVVQDVHETVVPFRRVTQELKPVQEQVHQVLPRGEQRNFYQAQHHTTVAAAPAVSHVSYTAPAVSHVSHVAAAPAVSVAAAPALSVAAAPAVSVAAAPAVSVAAPAYTLAAAPALSVAAPAVSTVAAPVITGLATGPSYGYSGYSTGYTAPASASYSVQSYKPASYSEHYSTGLLDASKYGSGSEGSSYGGSYGSSYSVKPASSYSSYSYSSSSYPTQK